MAKHTMNDLYQMQSLPLEAKVQMTKRRIQEWVDEYGEDGVYVSFSGGKDSTVLLDIARSIYPDIKAVFVDTGLEYPEIRQFVKTFENVDILKPRMTFKEVIEKYGYPLFSKEISECIDNSKKYIKILTDRQTDRQTEIPYAYRIADMLGIDRRKNKQNELYNQLKQGSIPDVAIRVQQVLGMESDAFTSMYDRSKYLFMLYSPFPVSNYCCKAMKKNPVKLYGKKTGRKPMTAQMATESKLRTSQWIKNGCNGFHLKSPISNPMSFWTEQDVLYYIYINKLPIASVYGDVIKDYDKMGQLDGQMDMSELQSDLGVFDIGRPLLKTTGCSRTGCMFCGFGCHLEKSPNRFEMMKETHPKQYDYIMRPKEEGGLNYKEVIDWINENGNMNIKY